MKCWPAGRATASLSYEELGRDDLGHDTHLTEAREETRSH